MSLACVVAYCSQEHILHCSPNTAQGKHLSVCVWISVCSKERSSHLLSLLSSPSSMYISIVYTLHDNRNSQNVLH